MNEMDVDVNELVETDNVEVVVTVELVVTVLVVVVVTVALIVLEMVDVADDVDVDDDVCVELVVVVGATTQLPPRQLPLVAFTTQPVPLANTGPLKQIPLLHMPSCRQTPE